MSAPQGMFEWATVARAKQIKFDEIAKHEASLAIVRSRAKKGRRTPDIRLMCNGHWSRLSLALSVDEDEGCVEIHVRQASDTWNVSYPMSPDGPRTETGMRILHVKGNQGAGRYDMVCRSCGSRTSRESVFVLTESIRALMGKGIPRIVWTKGT